MSTARPTNQSAMALALLRRTGLTRLSEFRKAGITAATISRLQAAGDIRRVARGLYQLPDADVSANHTLAEASKLAPKGIICLSSALAFHGLTDRIPARIWLAIGANDWRPRLTYPPMRFAHYSTEQLTTGVERHRIDGVREAIPRREATPGEIARYAAGGGVWKVMEPYVSALTHG